MPDITVGSTHVIIFPDRSTKFLNEGAYKFIYNAFMAGKESVPMNGTIYPIKNIKLMSLADYYEQYPKEKPQMSTLRDFSGQGYAKIIKYAPEKTLNGILKGMQKYIAENNPPMNSASRLLLTKMLIRKKEHEDEKAKKAFEPSEMA
jgi:hypothetical protein